MARGQQKKISQEKNAKRQAEQKKREAGLDGRSTAAVKLTVVCKVCKIQMQDLKTYKQHFVNKHPKVEEPEELKSV